MAKVDLHHFDRDLAYINGIEAGVNLVKRLYGLTLEERMTLFDDNTVPSILDKYNFAEIIDILGGIK